jgi:imidazolonepropionase-like amidohydrolase
MRKFFSIFLTFAFAILSLAQSNLRSQPQQLIITHVTVIDATGSAPKPDQTIVIAAGRIIEIGKSNKVRVPRGSQVLDATGKFLIPGLWDMHVHLAGVSSNPAWSKQVVLPLYVANGVTGVRDMGSDLKIVQQWRKEISEGLFTGPRIITPGPMLTTRKSSQPEISAVQNESEARESVRSLKNHGADFIKVIYLSRDSYMALADESKKERIPFAGHVPESVTAAEASDAGQKSIEHLSGILLACSGREDEIRKARAEARARSDRSALERSALEILDTYDEKKASLLFARFAKNGTWQVPTLVWTRANEGMENISADDDRLKYVPASLKEEWKPEKMREGLTPAYFALTRRAFVKELEIVGAMNRAGVQILAGSDSLDPYVFPGSSLHEELALLVKAGLTPIEALQAATRNAASYLGMLDTVGTIEQGKIADLVLLDANPLADIGNTQKISAVVLSGRLINKEAIKEMLANVETAANKK